MDQTSGERLSRITTLWSLVRQAHGGDESSAARSELLQRYCAAVYRYLLGALRNQDAAEELFQEFALRFVRGDFRQANPQRGRFRDYVKTAVIHLVSDYRRSLHAQPSALPTDWPAPAVPPIAPEDDDEFNRSWCEELINRTWEALRGANPSYHAVLLVHAENRDKQTPELLDLIQKRLGKPITAGNARVTLHRARERFADLLLTEVVHSLSDPDQAELLDELRSLGLLKLCGGALERSQVIHRKEEQSNDPDASREIIPPAT